MFGAGDEFGCWDAEGLGDFDDTDEAEVAFAEFDNPSSKYLRWRLARRGIEADVYDLDGDIPGGFDVAYSLDVIEHVEEPFAFLAELERRAAVVMVNFLEPDPGEPGSFAIPGVGPQLRF